jgi:hypothetical protein
MLGAHTYVCGVNINKTVESVNLKIAPVWIEPEPRYDDLHNVLTFRGRFGTLRFSFMVGVEMLYLGNNPKYFLETELEQNAAKAVDNAINSLVDQRIDARLGNTNSHSEQIRRIETRVESISRNALLQFRELHMHVTNLWACIQPAWYIRVWRAIPRYRIVRA